MIKDKIGIKPKVTMGRLGMLDILVDGNVVYSYQQTRRMPSDAEVLQLLSAK